MIENILTFLSAAVLLTLSPGPDILYVLFQGLRAGPGKAMTTALGLVCGIMVHTSLVAFGFSAILRQSEPLFLGVQIAGAAYLLYLAFKVYTGPSDIEIQQESSSESWSFRKVFLRGFWMNVLNPKVALFFLAFFPGFLWEPEEDILLQIYILGFLFMIQAFLIFSLVAVLAGSIAGFLNQHKNAGIVFKWLQILVFIGIAVFILF